MDEGLCASLLTDRIIGGVTMLWFAGTAVGLIIAIWASRVALDAAVQLGAHLGLLSFVIGVTIVAIGTDLPEVRTASSHRLGIMVI